MWLGFTEVSTGEVQGFHQALAGPQMPFSRGLGEAPTIYVALFALPGGRYLCPEDLRSASSSAVDPVDGPQPVSLLACLTLCLSQRSVPSGQKETHSGQGTTPLLPAARVTLNEWLRTYLGV